MYTSVSSEHYPIEGIQLVQLNDVISHWKKKTCDVAMVLMMVQSSIFYMAGCSTTSFVPLITAVSFRSRKIRDNFHILRLVSRPQHIIVWLPHPLFWLSLLFKYSGTPFFMSISNSEIQIKEQRLVKYQVYKQRLGICTLYIYCVGTTVCILSSLLCKPYNYETHSVE